MKRRRFNSDFKTKVVLAVLKEQNTAQEIAQKYKIHPQQVTKWKRDFLLGASQVFEKGLVPKKDEEQTVRDKLYKVIGELKVENDFLKKKLR